ncbi:hypothetical protein [Streptomyces beijiangensis]|uniref:Uncharacterized protein n=1 Tax=Streptomyces beijiangensis TaxID=163361 RepID=A0A939FC02_9ACTN|nr:hypothetical protein [Streptomyces beijiangensis]MBO0515803.1 hypothetical protein [Streptomyces beijiangensis]
MTDISWDDAFCSEGANCFRFGVDGEGKAYIGTTGTSDYVADSVEALRALISAVKAGAADHLLRPDAGPHVAEGTPGAKGVFR